ncbi:cytochrome ubiquinol oxidase subunit I [Solirubrobacter sp. CPCC 204708]|uniref:Cytochrome ubiquinol oxidase subunit I n=1 Tax=Solirubrobacter deserti TaxID=2282478 RepID=A0ABT4RD61_9ACTN|nr:cytochrome ubiquinol oxidase subunit I [Solirubrobacter deserti]MBE2317759.1 cytochrome ubiquinol oxidase subunit I [Solirubrobacter deserti]MDA0136464.1 cytochrome ubiquinol oxidase subunit I [Solirubrobacter deserti]
MADATLVVFAAEQVRGVLEGTGSPDALEARQMQALSLAVHIPLVCFGIAFPAMFLFVEGLYLRTGDPLYKALAKRWSKVALIIFATGVVTGTILSFEFGLLWPDFMATFGEVFGVAFGLEGISFFLEAIFIAIYVYGWDRLPKRTHILTGVPIIITGATGSAFVISVNGWMNDPQGFEVVNGQVQDPVPFSALLNGHVAHELVHMYLAGYLVAGFLVAAYYARRWLKGRRDRYTRTALVVPLAFAALAAPIQVVVGDWAGRKVAESQPVKLAAFEGVYKTEEGAAFHLGGFYDTERNEVRYGIKIPYLLSILAHHNPTAEVVGLESVPPEDRPPVNIVRTSFQTMIAIGTFLAALGSFFIFVWLRKRRLPDTKWFFRAVMLAGPLSVVALIAGWVTTEVGRQPWIVYGFMRTEDAVTSADNLEIGYAALIAVYVLLFGSVIWLLRRLASRPIETELDRG